MGIKYLNNYLRTNCSKEAIKCISLTELSGKKIAIDVSIYMYKYLSDDSLLENMYLLMSVLKHHNIIPIFVFDGKCRTEKKELLIKRKNDKKYAENEYNFLKEKLECNQDMDETEKLEISAAMDLLKKQFVYILREQINMVKDLISSYGMTYYEAEGEADELCALLVLKKKAWACLSEDMDMFVYGCTRVIRYFSLMNHTCVLYDTRKILDELGMSQTDFREICVLSGTDYNLQTDENENDFYQIIKLYNKYVKTKNNIGFYKWIEQNDVLVHDIKLLESVYNMFDLSTKANDSDINIEKIKIINGRTDRDKMNNILKSEGFIFAN